uniref:Chalcone-flavonone isomerase family protein n=1 Tax=Ananas comosus var. bracteatus TaxID=296719 RepID=A0A6V7NFU8_ANACO|nr:unnamed protein product [Ananas comosus var. bracteatus]
MVMVDGVPFAPEITMTKPLALLGHGITDIEIHFLQIKYNAIGIYLEKEKIVDHLGNWKGKKGTLLAEDDSFFEALVSAPMEKYFKVVVIKEIKGSQYGVQLESSVRDRLVAVDRYEEEEEEALEKIAEFFQTKYFKKDSVITFYFPVASCTAEITFATEEKRSENGGGKCQRCADDPKMVPGGSRAVSPTTVKSLADNIGALLSQ